MRFIRLLVLVLVLLVLVLMLVLLLLLLLLLPEVVTTVASPFSHGCW